MSLTLCAAAPGNYLLEIQRTIGEPSFVAMSVETTNAERPVVRIPAARRTFHWLSIGPEPVRLGFDAGEVSAARLLPLRLRDLWRLAQRPRVVARIGMTLAQDVRLIPLLATGGMQERGLARAARLLSGWGFDLAGESFQDTPGLFDAFPLTEPETQCPVSNETPRVAVVVHLHYQDLWPEFEAHLRRIKRPFQLIVTTSGIGDALPGRIHRVFPGARIFTYANRGRDVGPFLQLLNEGELDAYPLICKLHGKRTAAAGARAVFGQVWRRANLFDLIGSNEQVDRIIERFETEPAIGMVGSGRFRIPNARLSTVNAWGANRQSVLQILSRLGIDPDSYAPDFFAGTMFWVRSTVLRSLRRLALDLDAFPEEPSAGDGELHHAIERVFGALPPSLGMRLENAPGSDGPAAV